MCLHQAADLLDDPGRPPGWTFTDPAILQGWGRGSMMVPGPWPPRSRSWPACVVPRRRHGHRSSRRRRRGRLAEATIVGIDLWGPSLEAAAANVRAAGLGDRITVRDQDVAALDDSDDYDCVWFPTFFVTEAVLEAPCRACTGRCVRAAGSCSVGWRPPPDPLAQAASTLRTIRGGGADFDAKRLVAALEAAGCTAVRVLPRQGPAPMEYVIGQRPAV